MTGTTTAVLLAAGAGGRPGRGPKALLPFHGRPSNITSGWPEAPQDTGDRAFLEAHPEPVDVIDCSDLAGGRDVGTEADLVLLD